MLAEDDPSTNESLCEVLRPDYDVVATVNGEQAWKAAQEGRFDLILLDVLIPGVYGISFLQRLRSAANTAAVPIILLSASDEKEILLQGLKAGADDFILKPFNPAELLVRLSTHRHLTDLRSEGPGHERFCDLLPLPGHDPAHAVRCCHHQHDFLRTDV